MNAKLTNCHKPYPVVISALVLPQCSTMLRLLDKTQDFKHDSEIVALGKRVTKALVPVGVEPRVEPLQKNPPENPSVLAVHGVLDMVFF